MPVQTRQHSRQHCADPVDCPPDCQHCNGTGDDHGRYECAHCYGTGTACQDEDD